MHTCIRSIRAYSLRQRAHALFQQQHSSCRNARFFSNTLRAQLRVETESSGQNGAGQSNGSTPIKPTTLSEQPDAAALKNFAANLQSKGASLTTSKTGTGGGILSRAATEPYVAYGATQSLFGICSKPGSYTMPSLGPNEPKSVTSKGEEIGIPLGSDSNDTQQASDSQRGWYAVTQLTPTFNTWAQLTFLHMWILTVRFRRFESGHAKYWHQNLIDHFFYAAEDRMATLHGITTGGIRNRYLKDLHLQWRGCLAAYDEGFVASDAVLATALWRNLFGAAEDVDPEKLAVVVEWARKALSVVDAVSDEQLASGKVEFPDLALIDGQSRDNSPSMDEPFEA